ncbi:LCP family protein [Roseofilum acuticapitatum]|uniref:LCP family protein n=1 Tax=Roseofilum acuticapitatum TaxID=3082945 RepID=UPI0024BEF73D|nr:LCP family protein [Roseofilum acuticapitatum]
MSIHQTSNRKTTANSHPQPIPRPVGSGLRWLSIGLGLTGIALLSATAGALLAVSLISTPLMQSKLTPEQAAIFGKGEKISSGNNLQLPELTRPVNIMILGVKVLTSDVDTPPEEIADVGYHALVNSFEGLSDTMLMLRFEPSTHKVTLLSIPRDTRTWVEGHGLVKINAANYHGGPALSASSISELLGGVGIDRYVRINVQGIEKLIDALGGVTVHVPKDMKYQDDSQHLYINLKAGTQHLNGSQALQFLRYRYDNLGDIGRIQRQQMFMRAMIEQTLSPATIAKLPKILSIVRSHIDTNLSVEELLALANFAGQTDRSKMQMLLLPGRFSEPEEFDASYWVPQYSSIDALMAEHFDFGYDGYEDYSDYNDYQIDPTHLAIAIQDTTGQLESVDQLYTWLETQGYYNLYATDSWSDPLTTTRIIAQDGNIESARAIRNVLGFGEVRVESTGNLQSDVTIQLGQDWLTQTAQQPLLNSTPSYNSYPESQPHSTW